MRAQKLGFGIVATRGTAVALQEAGVQAETVLKIQEGRPNAADLMKVRGLPPSIRSRARVCAESAVRTSFHLAHSTRTAAWPALTYIPEHEAALGCMC